MNKNKVAFIFTGDVRDINILKKVMCYFNNIKNNDIYIGSYSNHYNILKKYSENLYLIDPLNDIIMPKNINKNEYQQNMLQWLHLDNVLKNYKNKLNNYDYIFKFRFDTNIINNDKFIQILNNPIYYIHNNNLYNNSDIIFYGNKDTFHLAFNDFYDNVIYNTMKFSGNNKENSFEKSWKSEPAFKINLNNKYIINNNSLIETKILRGIYNKKKGDGNNQIYDNNLLKNNIFSFN